MYTDGAHKGNSSHPMQLGMVNTQMLGVSKKYTYMKTVSILILVLISLNSCRQKAYNNFQVDECIKAYNTQVDSLEKIGEIEKAMKIMFDSIGACVEGLSLKNYSFKLANEEELNFSTINKPSIIKITASTCAPCIAEIPAINRIAEEFKDELKIIVLFQDNVHYVQKNRSKYSALIDLVPSAIRSENNSQQNNSEFNHFLGFPASYFLDEKQVINYLSQGATMAKEKSENANEITTEDANEKNYQRIKQYVNKLLKQ